MRVASKSLRVRRAVEEVLTRPGYRGVLAYALPEALWWVELGQDDVLVAYPSVDEDALARWIMDPAARAAVTVAVDSPDHLARIAAVDHATGRVRVLAGTLLHQLGPLVGAHGLALANMGDIDRQSVGGALSTSTHGTGLGLTGYAGMVTGLRLATADGALHWVDAEHEPELFEAARVRLGSPGVIVEAELQCVPAFAERSRTADHLEFYWFPGTDVALTKENTRRPLGDGVDPVGTFRSTVMDGLLTNGHYGLMCRAGRGSRGSCRP